MKTFVEQQRKKQLTYQGEEFRRNLQNTKLINLAMRVF